MAWTSQLGKKPQEGLPGTTQVPRAGSFLVPPTPTPSAASSPSWGEELRHTDMQVTQTDVIHIPAHKPLSWGPPRHGELRRIPWG